MKVVTSQFQKNTKGFNDIVDITFEVQQFIVEENLHEGQMLVFINGATASISTIEYEPGLLKDVSVASQE